MGVFPHGLRGPGEGPRSRDRGGRLCSDLTKSLIVLLVLLLILIALPLGMATAMGMCPDGHVAACQAGIDVCVAILAALWVGAGITLGTKHTEAHRRRLLLLVRALEHPPRVA